MATDLQSRPAGEDSDEDKQPLFDNDTPQGVYDDEFERMVGRGQMGTDPEHKPKPKKKSDSPKDLDSKEKSGGTTDASDAAQSESSMLPGEKGGGGRDGLFNPEDSKNPLVRLAGRVNRRRALLGGGAAAGIVALIIALFAAILPLKINNMVEKLQTKFFSSTNSAVDKWVDKEFSKYVKKYVLPNLSTSCPSTRVNRSCIADIPGNGKVAKMYRGWRDANLEGKLAKNYNIEFEKRGSSYYIKTPELPADGENITKLLPGTPGEVKELRDFPALKRSEVRTRYLEAIKSESWLRQISLRFKIGGLLDRKYGIERCIFFCTTKDKASDWGDNVKLAARYKTIERVLTPRSEYLGTVMECVVSGGCDNYLNSGDEDNARRTEFEEKMAQKLTDLKSRLGTETVEQIIKDSDAILKDGFTKYAIQSVFKKVGLEAAGETVNKSIPIIGWINLVASLVSRTAKFGGQLKRFGYVTQAGAVVSMYMMYRSYVDETKRGKADPDLAASMASTLGDNTKNAEPAEASPLYANTIGTNAPDTTTASWLWPSAMAASSASTTSNYTCDNGSKLAKGLSICPEESLVTSNFLTSFSDEFKKDLAPLVGVADFWNSTAGKVLHGIGNIIGGVVDKVIPGPVKDAYASLADKVFEKVGDTLLPSPCTENESGARTFNCMAAGADVAGHDSAAYNIGGKQITQQQAAAIETEQENYEREAFDQQPMFARLFDTNNTRSLVSRLAMTVPISRAAAIQGSFGGLLRNPFEVISKSFGAIFSSPRAFAATPQADPFGIPQIGIPVDDPVYSMDSDILTDDYCAQLNKAWAVHDIETRPDGTQIDHGDIPTDPATGSDVHHYVNPCLLNDMAITSAGGFFTTDVISPKDLGSQTDNGPTSGNTNIFVVGDSLTVGMRDSGKLQQKLESAGWTVNKIEATVGDRVSDALPKVEADAEAVRGADTAVVALGTNHDPNNQAAFEQAIASMVTKLKSYNPSITIYWMNAYTQKSSYPGVNAAINASASKLGIKVIDWQKEATGNPGAYPFAGDGIHHSGAGFDAKANFLVHSVQLPNVTTAMDWLNDLRHPPPHEPTVLERIANYLRPKLGLNHESH